MLSIRMTAVAALKMNARNARTHSKKQVRQIADSIQAFGFLVPVLVDENGLIIAGHGRYEAARLLGLKTVPVIEVTGLARCERVRQSLPTMKSSSPVVCLGLQLELHTKPPPRLTTRLLQP